MSSQKSRIAAVLSLAFLLLVASGPSQADEGQGPARAEPELSDLDVVTSRLADEVERIRGQTFETTPRAVFLDPFQMMLGGPCMDGSGGPSMGGPGGPSTSGRNPFSMMQMMGRAVVGLAALGLVPAEDAAKWIGKDGRLTMPNPWELFAPPGGGAGGPGGGMPPMPGLPGASAPEGIMGAFYRDDAGLITVMKRGGDPERALLEQILVHELTHALDDQHHDISRFAPGGSFEGDRGLAAQALVEGSAVFSELDWTTRVESNGRLAGVLENEDLPRFGGYLNADGTPAQRQKKGRVRMEAAGRPGQGLPGVAKSPKLMAKRAVFPYAYGFEFVKHLRANGISVDQAYEDLPGSSEQIMHPELYLAEPRDEPTTISVKDLDALLAAGDAVQVDDRTLGEFLMCCVFEEHGIEGAPEVAAGWDGDRLVVATLGGEVGLLWVSTWDSEGDAAAFETAIRAVLGRRYPDAFVVLREGSEVMAAGGLGDAIHARLIRSGVAGVVASGAGTVAESAGEEE